MKSTNYTDTLIRPAEDCRVVAKRPDKPDSIAGLQYAMIADRPYALTSDDLLSAVAARRQGVDAADLAAFRAAFFAKGQACLRCSPLTKTHGWAIHCDAKGQIALLPPGGPEVAALMKDPGITQVMAMRNARR